MCSTFLIAHFLHYLLKYVDFSLNYFCQKKFAGLCRSMRFSNFMIFFLRKVQSWYIFVNHFNLNLWKVMELYT